LREELAPRATDGVVAVAVEGCTGWRYVVEEVAAAGFEAHVAEPADTQAARGRKKHAKTDRSDARLLRELLQSGDLPEICCCLIADASGLSGLVVDGDGVAVGVGEGERPAEGAVERDAGIATPALPASATATCARRALRRAVPASAMGTST